MASAARPRQPGPLLTLRCGHGVMAWHDEGMAAKAADRFCGGASLPRDGTAAPGGLPGLAAEAVSSALAALAASFPLHGPATRNFGTALRVEAVRARVGEQQLRGEPLLRILTWIAAAADA